MAQKIRIGDVIEILTKRGLAYAQYTHEFSMPPRWGSLIKVLQGFYAVRPSNFDDVVRTTTQFKIFFPLQDAINKKLVTTVANEPVPAEDKKFPIFRTGLPNPENWKVEVWWFWDGEKEWKVGEITEEQKKLPIRGVVNYTRLLEMIESDWLPQTDINT